MQLKTGKTEGHCRVHHDVCPLCQSTSVSFEKNVRDYSITREAFDLWQCSDCGFLFTQDAPSETAISPFYKSEDYVSHSDTSRGLFYKVYHLVRKHMLSQKYSLIRQLKSGPRLLDVGCGTGYFLNYMKEKGYEVKGIEKDDEARYFAIRKFDLPVVDPGEFFNSECFEADVITLWHVLEHLHDIEGYMGRFKKDLASGGKLVIAVPNYTSTDARIYGEYWAGYDVPRHLWHFSPSTVEKMMINHGFRLTAKKGMPFDPFYVSVLSEKHKGTSLALIRGFFNGLKSYIKAVGSPEKASSVIYIFEKTDFIDRL